VVLSPVESIWVLRSNLAGLDLIVFVYFPINIPFIPAVSLYSPSLIAVELAVISRISGPGGHRECQLDPIL
jgi:hypothetical protein